jgi:TonB-dependent SusC/RagA subfamily outer membrane receptor
VPLLLLAALPLAACAAKRPAARPADAVAAADTAKRRPRPPADARAAAGGRTLSADDYDAVKVARAEELFAGRFPGVLVTRTASGDLSVQIRGTSTLIGTTEPLYVVDGLALPPGTGGLISVPPNDIERIEILKDAGSTAYYGVRGANGVVLIRTKRR